MTSITTTPGLKSIDPIEGLAAYVQTIKPYHTKIFEISFEYVYTDAVKTTVIDTMDWDIPDIENDSIDASATEFIETLSFDWSGNYSYTILAINGNTISVAGNVTTELKTEDLTEINSNPYTIVSFVYDAMNDLTVITLNVVPVAAINDIFVVQNVDITYWYQFTIQSVNPIAAQPSQASPTQNIGNPSDLASAQSLSNFLIEQPHTIFFPQQSGGFTLAPTITVQGNAMTSVQVGAEFLIQGSGVNDGLYHAVYLQYLPLTNQTLIGVGPTTGVLSPALIATGGGMVVPYRFINQTQSGSYDNGGYDAGPYDQSAGSIIHQ